MYSRNWLTRDDLYQLILWEFLVRFYCIESSVHRPSFLQKGRYTFTSMGVVTAP